MHIYEYIIRRESRDIRCTGADAINYSRIMGYPIARALFVDGKRTTEWEVVSYSGEQTVTYFRWKDGFCFCRDAARRAYARGLKITRYRIIVFDDKGTHKILDKENFKKGRGNVKKD